MKKIYLKMSFFISQFNHASRLTITSISVNDNNPYYKMVNKSVYSKDLKKSYII
ncbi:MAG: hypothetical protein L6U99_03690 [Clostridium sp.]|nr:MAG: hypothetical protein L6U99_03690 [Clostridium sp.]